VKKKPLVDLPFLLLFIGTRFIVHQYRSFAEKYAKSPGSRVMQGKEMKPISRHIFVFAATLACAAAAGAQNHGKVTRNSNQIGREELQSASAANAYDLVQALRPQWLRDRGRETIRTQQVARPGVQGRIEVATTADEPDILVYINDSRFGNVDALRDIAVAGLGSLEFVSPAKATLRWGSGHTKGVIVVHTWTGTSP